MTQTTTQTEGMTLPPPSRVSRLVAGAVGVLAGVLALATVGAVLTSADQPYWMVVGFEVVVVAAAVFSLLIAKGKFGDGPGMALLCVAGTLLVAGVLGYLSTRGTQGALLVRGRSIPMKPWALAHMGAAFIMAAVAAYEVLRRNSRSRYYLARAAMAGVPLAALAAAAYLAYRKSAAAEAVYQSAVEAAFQQGTAPPPAPDPLIPSWVTWLGGSLGAVVALVLFCACAHCVIRAFEMGKARARST